MVYLQVNALGEWIIGIYLHEFTNNEREISIPHEAASCGIEDFEFIVSERVQVNPDNSRAMSALTFLLFKLNTLQTKIVKLWVSRSHGVMTVVYRIYTTAITPRKWSQGGCCVITQCHVVQINQSEHWNSYSVWKLNNKSHYTIIYKNGERMRDFLGLFVFIVV